MEPDSGNLDELEEDSNPCLIVMNSQVEDPKIEGSRVGRLQQLPAFRDTSNKELQDQEREKENKEGKPMDEDEEELIPPSQADDVPEENELQKRNQTLIQSFISTPSETLSSLHISAKESMVLVRETSDETISTQQSPEDMFPVVSSSPSDHPATVDSKDRLKDEDEDVQVPEWQRAINAAEVHAVTSSKEVSSASNSSESAESMQSPSLCSAPSLQLLQNWQDPNQIESSQSVKEKADVAMQASLPKEEEPIFVDSQQLSDSVQIITNVQSGIPPHPTSDETSDSTKLVVEEKPDEMEGVSSSQDFRLRLTQSQTETEAEGITVHMDAAFQKEKPAGFKKGSPKRLIDDGGKRRHDGTEVSELGSDSNSSLTSSLGKERPEKKFSKEDVSTVRATRQAKSLDYEEMVHEETSDERRSSSQPSVRQSSRGKDKKSLQDEQERSVTPSSIAEITIKDSLSESNTSQPSGMSFHLNLMKDGSHISPLEIQGGLLASKKFKHSTPIVSEVEEEEEEDQRNTISEKSDVTNQEQQKITNSTNRSLLTISEQDSMPTDKEREMEFHLNVPSTEDIEAIRESPTKKNMSVFSGVQQSSLSSARQLTLRDEADPASHEDDDPFAREDLPREFDHSHQKEAGSDPLNLNRERDSDSSSDTLPVEEIADLAEPSSVTGEVDKPKRKRKARETVKDSEDFSHERRYSKRKYTEVTDPYRFTDSQSNRVPSPLKQSMDQSRLSASIDLPEKGLSTHSRRRANSSRKGRTTAGNGAKEAEEKDQKLNPPSEKENRSRVGETGSKVEKAQEKKGGLSFMRQSSSSSSSGNQQHFSRQNLPDDGDGFEFKYAKVWVEYKYKRVYCRGRCLKTYTKELSRTEEEVDGSETEEWPISPTSSMSGYHGDVSSLGSRSSSNVGTLEKSASIGSKSTSSSTSLGKDSSPAKTPSPQVPLQTRRSMNRTSSSSSTGKSSHGNVHFSPELEETFGKQSSIAGKDAKASEFKQPEGSVKRTSLSPKERPQSDVIFTETTQEEKEAEGTSATNIKETPSPEKEDIRVEGRWEAEETEDALSRPEETLNALPQDTSNSSRVTQLPESNVHRPEEETVTEGGKQGSTGRQTKSQRRKGRRKTARGKKDDEKKLDSPTSDPLIQSARATAAVTPSSPAAATVIRDSPPETGVTMVDATMVTVESPSIEILDIPPSTTATQRELQASSAFSEKLDPGTKVLCKWPHSRFYYPSVIKSQIKENKYLVLYDDMSEREVARGHIVCKEWLSKGQPVFFTEGDFVESAIVVGYFKDVKSRTVGYVIEDGQGNCKRVSKTNVLLNQEQASNLMQSSTSSCSDVTLENVVVGKRTSRPSARLSQPASGKEKRKEKRSTVTPTSQPRRTTRSRSRSKDKTEESNQDSTTGGQISKSTRRQGLSHSLMSVQVEDTASVEELSGSTPRSGVKRKKGQTKDQGVSVRKKLALDVDTERQETESPTPRRSPRKGQSPTPSSSFGPMPKSKMLFKGYAFLVTQVANRSQESEDNFTRDESHGIIPFHKEHATKQIMAGGGTVIKDLEKTQVTRGNVFLVADAHCRTKKYLLALASAVPCISYMWLNESCRTGKIQRYQDYILPAGESCEEGGIVEWHPNRYHIMDGLTAVVISSERDPLETWRCILMAAGCDIVSRLFSDDVRSRRDFSLTCDVIITDPSCPRSILSSARELGVPVVSAEWLYQCLINGRRVPYDSSHKYKWDYRDKQLCS